MKNLNANYHTAITEFGEAFSVAVTDNDAAYVLTWRKDGTVGSTFVVK